MRHYKPLPLIILYAFVSACSTSSTREDISYDQTTTAKVDIAQQASKTPEIEPNAEQKEISSTDYSSQSVAEIIEHQPSDIWQKIRLDLELQRNISHKAVKDRIAWYSRNQEYIDRVVTRATPYIYYITEKLKERDMPLDLALLPIVESAYHPFAYSPSRASGIWQFIPGTGKLYGLKQNWWYDGRRDIVAATEAAMNYLQKLHKEFDGDWLLALAAYNTGEKKVARAIRNNKKAGKPTDFWSLRLPRETRGYVPSLLAVAEIVAHPGKYKITINHIPNSPYFAEVNIGSQIDLATAARLANLSMDELYTFNPGFNRWATDPSGPHRLLIPVNKAESFKKQLAALSNEERIKWQQHIILNGESLGQIAARYHTDVSTLKQVNQLRGNLIREGRSLLIPVSKKPLKHYTLSLDSRRFRGLKRTGDGKKYIYTVKRGDNLWDIGRNYGISVKQLCAWNGISHKSLLHPGQKLAVWVKDDGNESDNKIIQVAEHTVKSQKQGHFTYTIQNGDSLWLISKRFGVSVKQLQSWNNLRKGRYLQPGQELDIYMGKSPTDA